jgi:hypothetical protein
MMTKEKKPSGGRRRDEDASRKGAYEPKKPTKVPKIKPPEPPPKK